MIRVGIVGAAGYAGGEVARLLLGHGGVRIAALGSRSSAGKPASQVHPGLRGYDLPCFDVWSGKELASGCDVVFVAAPSGAAWPLVQEIIQEDSSVRVIDLGADFRLKDPQLYADWYGFSHGAPELLSEAVYGLSELYREKVRNARIVANPGCYPTAAILALAPLAQRGLIHMESIVIDAKSGVSGAGRTPAPGYHFAECCDNARPYNLPRHRHIPEIEQELTSVAIQAGLNAEALISFTPHLIPMSRGILTTAYASLRKGAGGPGEEMDTEGLTRLYERFYAGERFIRVLTDGLPETKAVAGSNFCDIAVRHDRRTMRVVAMSAIDNLVKGAAGQAIQNMNIMFGEREERGLIAAPLRP